MARPSAGKTDWDRYARAELDPLATVRQSLGECRRCGLCDSRSRIVFGEGAVGARVVVVGGAPDGDDDRAGTPFAGESGRMLDKMLENVLGVTPAQAYRTNVVKCWPGGRAPVEAEVATCLQFLEEQVRAVAPRAILALGPGAARSLDPAGEGAYGRAFTAFGVPAMATHHPLTLLAKPELKRETMAHLMVFRSRL